MDCHDVQLPGALEKSGHIAENVRNVDTLPCCEGPSPFDGLIAHLVEEKDCMLWRKYLFESLGNLSAFIGYHADITSMAV